MMVKKVVAPCNGSDDGPGELLEHSEDWQYSKYIEFSDNIRSGRVSSYIMKEKISQTILKSLLTLIQESVILRVYQLRESVQNMTTAVIEKTRNIYFNPNPNLEYKKKKNHPVGDCVIRSMCKATEQDWDTVYKEMCELGFELKAMPSDDITWREYLTRKGFIKHSIKVTKGSKRPTVQGFSRDNKKGTFVLQVAGHLVTTVDGYFYDVWDCGDSSLYQYWEKV